MASINIEEEWNNAIALYESTVEEWEKSANDRHRLNAGELEAINSFLEDIQQFVVAHGRDRRDLIHLIQFYSKFERVATALYLGSIKMMNRA